jgi:hypothetical protein
VKGDGGGCSRCRGFVLVLQGVFTKQPELLRHMFKINKELAICLQHLVFL